MEKNEVTETLKKWAPKGTRIYTILRGVSRSGMRREISLLIVNPSDGGIHHIDNSAAAVLGYRMGKHDGVLISGCGMDMGFALVSELASKLYGDDYALTHSWL